MKEALGLTKKGTPRVRAPGGGAKPKPPGQVTQVVSASLLPSEIDAIKAYGAGSYTAGIRQLLAMAAAGKSQI